MPATAPRVQKIASHLRAWPPRLRPPEPNAHETGVGNIWSNWNIFHDEKATSSRPKQSLEKNSRKAHYRDSILPDTFFLLDDHLIDTAAYFKGHQTLPALVDSFPSFSKWGTSLAALHL